MSGFDYFAHKDDGWMDDPCLLSNIQPYGDLVLSFENQANVSYDQPEDVRWTLLESRQDVGNRYGSLCIVLGQNCRGHFLLVLTEYDVTVLLSPNPAKVTAEADISFCTSLPTALLVPCS